MVKVEIAFLLQAGIVAKSLWPEINEEMVIVFSKARSLTVPIYNARKLHFISEQWAKSLEEGPLSYSRETIELKAFKTDIGCIQMGYGPMSKTLAVKYLPEG